ncbi:MAG TPA: hypothetical protein DEF43_12615 [Chloroflexus aurantiacus]|nr:hypothetical protein [Chloroflexus aurantiacus]
MAHSSLCLWWRNPVDLADLLARTLAAPAEIPVGLFTSFAGGPFFLALILRTRRHYGFS